MGSEPPLAGTGAGAGAGQRRYRIQSRLARGSSGEAFRAIAVADGRSPDPVVVKRILPIHAGGSEMAERFLSQARIMGRLAHENLVRLLDFGVCDDGNFLVVQELVDGLGLGRLCRWVWARDEQVPVHLALFIAAEALHGLAHAHAAEGGHLVHRDVSPGNVLLSTRGEVKVADFGVALAAREQAGAPGSGADPRHGGRYLVVGKPDYMAPEQFDGEPVDARADLFSVAVVLFELLTGSRPFPGTMLSERMEAARAGRAQPVRELRPEVSTALEALLGRALAPRPEHRFPDAASMADALLALAREAEAEAGEASATREELAELVFAALRDATPGQPSLRPGPDASGEDDDLLGRDLVREEGSEVFTVTSTEAAEGGAAEAAEDALAALGLLVPDPAGGRGPEETHPDGRRASLSGSERRSVAAPPVHAAGARRRSGGRKGIWILAVALLGMAVAAGALRDRLGSGPARAGVEPSVGAAASIAPPPTAPEPPAPAPAETATGTGDAPGAEPASVGVPLSDP